MFSVKLMQARGEREKSMSERRSEIKDDRRQFVAFFRPAQLNARRVWGSAQNRKERDKTNDGRHFFPRSSTCASRSLRLLRLPNKRNKKWHQLDMFWLFICSFIHFFWPLLLLFSDESIPTLKHSWTLWELSKPWCRRSGLGASFT